MFKEVISGAEDSLNLQWGLKEILCSSSLKNENNVFLDSKLL